MTTPIVTEKLLFKKYLGVAAAYPTLTYNSEQPARPSIYPSQIFSQIIPPTAPTAPANLNDPSWNVSGYITGDGNGVYTINNGNNIPSTTYGVIYTNKINPQLQYISKLYLSPVTSGTSYYFGNNSGTYIPNLLINSISAKYDPIGSYAMTLYSSNTIVNNNTYLPQNNPQWFVDNDSGNLYFTNGDWNNSPGGTPIISFYKYNGSIGLSTLPGATTMLSTLNVSGNTTLNAMTTMLSKLNVSGITTLNAATTMLSSLNVSGALTCSTSGYISAGTNTNINFSLSSTSLSITLPQTNYGAGIYHYTSTIADVSFNGGIMNGTYIIYISISSGTPNITIAKPNGNTKIFINGGPQTFNTLNSSSQYVILSVLFDGTNYFVSAANYS
jgi:hypothetical protein